MDKYCLASERETASMIDSYALAVVENNDMHVDNDTPHSIKTFSIKIFSNCPQTANFVKDVVYTMLLCTGCMGMRVIGYAHVRNAQP